MTTSRRSFLQTSMLASAAAAGLAANRAFASTAFTRDPVQPAERKLRILILGGTGFLGPHTVRYARERGHTLTLFNRGKTNPHLFPNIEQRHGDRDPQKGEGLNALEQGEWDAVVDTSGYVPRIVDASARLLRDRVNQYLFVSTVSVYADMSTPGVNEESPLATMEDETSEDVPRFYGPLKALCEHAAENAMPGRTTLVRPGLIVGPGDPTDRFTYWPARLDRGGEILAPGQPDHPVQYIDARDLAAFIVRCLEENLTGPYLANGPHTPTTIAELVHGCKAVAGYDATFTWVPADFLQARNVGPWTDLPVWIPPVGEYAGFHRADVSKAVAAGLAFRPLAQTVADTLDWWREQPAERRAKPRAGLTPERERDLLDAWHQHRPAPADSPA